MHYRMLYVCNSPNKSSLNDGTLILRGLQYSKLIDKLHSSFVVFYFVFVLFGSSSM